MGKKTEKLLHAMIHREKNDWIKQLRMDLNMDCDSCRKNLSNRFEKLLQFSLQLVLIGHIDHILICKFKTHSEVEI